MSKPLFAFNSVVTVVLTFSERKVEKLAYRSASLLNTAVRVEGPLDC